MSRDVSASPLLNAIINAATAQTSSGSTASTGGASLTQAIAQTIAQVVVQELAGQNKLSQPYSPNDLSSLSEPAQTEPAQTSPGSGSSSSTLQLTDKTTPKQVAQFLGPIGQRPKMALTQTGAPYWVLGTFQNAQGQTMVRTSNPMGQGGTSDMPLSDFMKGVKTLDADQSGAGTEVATQTNMPSQVAQETGLKPGASYKFNGFYQDPKTQQMMVSLTGPQGNVNVQANMLSSAFGMNGLQKFLLHSLSPGAQSDFTQRNVGGPSTDGNSFGVADDTTPQELGNWLQQGKGPQMAADKTGNLWVVDKVTRDSSGQPQVTVEDPTNPDAEPQTMSLAEFTQNTNMVDRAQSGRGTPLKTADGSKATFMGLGTDPKTGKALVYVQTGGSTKAMTLDQFAKAFGKSALQSALNDSLSEPAKPKFSDLQSKNNTASTGDGTGEVANDPSNAAGNIDQGRVGDCYFLAALGGVEKQNPQALQQMIRPSTDGDPHHYDVRFYMKDPQTGGTKPVWVTVDDKLPVNSQGQFVGDKPLSNASGLAAIAPALVEKAYAKLNQQYHVDDNADTGYDGISGGNPATAMTLLTGQPSQMVMTQNSSASALWQALQQSNSGAPVSLCTLAGNSPQAGLAPNIVQSHAYTVMGTYTDAKTGQQMVTLRNPWGSNTDASGKKIPGTNGVFSIPLSEVQKYFAFAALGSDGSASAAS